MSLLSFLVALAGWIIQPPLTRSSYRGLSVVNAKTVWISGSRARFLRTSDGGQSWKVDSIAGDSTSDLRDIEAFDDRTAVAISAGPAEQGHAKIFRTVDGGATWATVFTTDQKGVFFDAISFWDRDHGIVMSDPVDGRPFLLLTDDGGKTWSRVPPDALPATLANEGSFAASGTCLTVQGSSNAWIVTGGSSVARVFRSTDRGRTWSVAETPVHSGDGGAAGIFSVAFRDPKNGIVVGGNYSQPRTAYPNVAITADGGATWRVPTGPTPPGYLSAVTYLRDGRTLVATGLVGTAISTDGGERWAMADTVGYNAVAFAGQDAGWAVGDRGRVAKWSGPVELTIPIRKP